MDKQIQHAESPLTIAALIPALEKELSVISISVEKAAEIRKHLKSENIELYTRHREQQKYHKTTR